MSAVPLKSILSPQFLPLLQVYFCIQLLFHLCTLILHDKKRRIFQLYVVSYRNYCRNAGITRNQPDFEFYSCIFKFAGKFVQISVSLSQHDFFSEIAGKLCYADCIPFYNLEQPMLEDFKRRFIVSFVLTFPILLLSPMIQDFFNFELRVPGADYLTFLLSSVVYLYGGYPFLKGIKDELSEKSPGMGAGYPNY